MSQALSDMRQTGVYSCLVCPATLGHVLFNASRAVAAQPSNATKVEIIQ
jgi:hypothetical protein